MNLHPWPRTESWHSRYQSTKGTLTTSRRCSAGDLILGTDFRHAVEFSRSGRAKNPALRPSSSACVVLLGAGSRPRGRPRRREKVTWVWLGLSNRPLVTRATCPQPARDTGFTHGGGPWPGLRGGQPAQRAGCSRGSDRAGGRALDAGHVPASPPEDEPPARQPVPLARHGVGIGDPLVVEVCAALLHGAACLGETGDQTGELHELGDRRDVSVDGDAARLAERGAEGLLPERGQVVPAEQCPAGRLGLAEFLLAVHEAGELLGEG